MGSTHYAQEDAALLRQAAAPMIQGSKTRVTASIKQATGRPAAR